MKTNKKVFNSVTF